MSIFTKILLGLVLVATLPAIYFTAGVLNVQGAWRTKVKEFQVAVERQKTLAKDLEFGNEAGQSLPYKPGKPLAPGQVLGVIQLETARNNLVLDNGRVWFATRLTQSINPELNSLKMVVYDNEIENSNFGGDPANGGRKELTVEQHGLTSKTVVYVFQMKHNGEVSDSDRYVGEFVVEGLIESNVPLKPTRPLTPAQWDKLREAPDKDPTQWVVYDRMPIDSHDVFNSLDEDQIKARVPPEVALEYINDGKEPSEAILADEKLSKLIQGDDKTGKKFVRPLRDYLELFRTADVRLDEMADKLQILKKELEYAKRGEENAKMIIVGLDARHAKLLESQKVVDAELKVVKEHSEKLTAAVEEMKAELSKLLAENRRRREAQPAGGKTAAMPPLEAGAALGAD